MTCSYRMLIKILQQHFGIVILNEEQYDFRIDEYIIDSVAFIEFIVAIEQEIESQLPDDFLNFELLSSAKGFSEKLEAYMDNQRNEQLCNFIDQAIN